MRKPWASGVLAIHQLVPADIQPFLPWNLSAEKKKSLGESGLPEGDDTSSLDSTLHPDARISAATKVKIQSHPGERWTVSCCVLNKRDGRSFTCLRQQFCSVPIVTTRLEPQLFLTLRATQPDLPALALRVDRGGDVVADPEVGGGYARDRFRDDAFTEQERSKAAENFLGNGL